jgi:hypothetical protein
MDRRVGATANNPQDGAFLIQNMYGTPAPAYNNAALDAMERPQASSQQYNNAALDAMERPQASSQQYNFDAAEPYGLGPRAIPAQGNRLASQQAYGPPVNSNELAPPAPTVMPTTASSTRMPGRRGQLYPAPPTEDDTWDFLDYIVPAAAEAERTPERTGPLIENPAREFATPAPVRQAWWRPEGLWDVPPPTVASTPTGTNPAAEFAVPYEPIPETRSDIMTLPAQGQKQWWEQDIPFVSEGLRRAADALPFPDAPPTDFFLDAQGRPIYDPNYGQQEATPGAPAGYDPVNGVIYGDPYEVPIVTRDYIPGASLPEGYSVPNPSYIPGATLTAEDSRGVRQPAQQTGGTSAGVTPPATGGLAGNVPAKTILNPDGTLVARDAAFSSGELFPDDTFIADDGTEGRMGTFYVADDESGSLIPVTPAPGTTQAIKEAGGDIWTLDDTEFDTLVEAGLVDEADREAMVGRPMAIGKEWVDALGGNVTYETVAAAPAADTSAAGGGGGNTRSSGSRSSYGSRSYGGGGGGNYGGRSSYGGSGGGFAGDVAAFFGPDFMGGWFAADGGNGREGTPFESPIFDRYFATRDGRRLTRRRRSRRRSMRRGSAQMPDMNKTIRRGGGDTASSNLDRARQLQERT